jgi:DNA-binding Xre family transcriptional regulator
MLMRLRIPELLAERGLTPYAVARDSGGRISLSTIYRLKDRRGQLDTFAADMLEALCDVLGVKPGDLFERDENGAASPNAATGRARKPAARKRATKTARA